MHTITYACSCCGEVVDKDNAADHMLTCEKHPYAAMKRRAEVAEADADRLAENHKPMIDAMIPMGNTYWVEKLWSALTQHETALEARK